MKRLQCTDDERRQMSEMLQQRRKLNCRRRSPHRALCLATAAIMFLFSLWLMCSGVGH